MDFAEWRIKHHADPCQRQVFEQLLYGAGFRLEDGFAAGLLLNVDLEAVLQFQTSM